MHTHVPGMHTHSQPTGQPTPTNMPEVWRCKQVAMKFHPSSRSGCLGRPRQGTEDRALANRMHARERWPTHPHTHTHAHTLPAAHLGRLGEAGYAGEWLATSARNPWVLHDLLRMIPGMSQGLLLTGTHIIMTHSKYTTAFTYMHGHVHSVALICLIS